MSRSIDALFEHDLRVECTSENWTHIESSAGGDLFK